jgi:hypothetical protein
MNRLKIVFFNWTFSIPTTPSGNITIIIMIIGAKIRS